MASNSTGNQDLIERFLAAYNAIDRELRHRLQLDEYEPFKKVVRTYAAKLPSWREERALGDYADLRNFISHTSTQPYERLAVPTETVVADIERIRDGFSQHVIPRYQRDVATLHDDQSLSEVLALIARTDYSQFPVRDGDSRFKGLLTENGITRWLAHHVVKEMSLVEFQEVPVADVLNDEETRTNHLFKSLASTLDEVFSEFASRPLLEAILITQSGKCSEKMLGIVTRWDVLNTS